MADELDDVIGNTAAAPKSASGDSTSATSHSLPDLISADKYICAKAAAKSGGWPRRMKMVPPGAV